MSPIVEAREAYYFLRLKQRREAAVPPLDGVKEQDREQAPSESKAYELALQEGNSLLDQVKKGKDVEKVARANRLETRRDRLVSRSAPQLPKIGELAEIEGGPLTVSEQKPFADRLYTQKDAALHVRVQGKPGR